MSNEEYYSCSQHIYFKKVDVVRAVHEIFELYGDMLDLNFVYDELRKKFRVKSFNKANLRRLILEIGKFKKSTRIILDIEKIHNILYSKVNLSIIAQEVSRANYLYSINLFFSNDATQILADDGIVVIEDLVNVILENESSIKLHINELTNVLRLLRTDIKNMVFDFLYEFIKKCNKKDNDVLLLRSEGKTLEEIGNIYSLSRERIRQIEKRKLGYFFADENFSKRKLVFDFIKFKSKKYNRIHVSELEDIMGDYSKFIPYFVKNQINYNFSEIGNVYFYDEYGILNISEIDWLEDFNNILENSDEILDINEFNSLTLKMVGSLSKEHDSRDIEFVSQFLCSKFNKNGNYYTKSGIGIKQRYIFILNKYFKEGIRIYDSKSLDDFRIKYCHEFKDSSIFQKGDRAISVRLSDVASQVDKGTYTGPEHSPKISKINLKLIEEFIERESRVILTKQIFNEFSTELEKDNIKNRYLLHAELKTNFRNKYFFRRNYIAKSNDDYNMLDELEFFLSNKKGFITISELDRKFPSVDNIFVLAYLSNSDVYISAFNQRWISINDIDINSEEKLVLKTLILDSLEKNGQVTAQRIMDEAKIIIPNFFRNNSIEYQHFFFGILSKLFNESFDFNRPYITRIGDDFITREEQLSDYLKGNDFVFISDLKDYIDKNKIKINSIKSFLNSINEDFIRVDKDLLCSEDYLSLREKDIQNIENSLDIIFENKESVDNDEIFFSLFPDLIYEWNSFLLESIIIKYMKNSYYIQSNNNDYRKSDFVIKKMKGGIV